MAVKPDRLQLNKWDIFLIFPQFIRVHIIYDLSKNEEKYKYPYKPQFYFLKMGLRGFKVYGCVSMMTKIILFVRMSKLY